MGRNLHKPDDYDIRDSSGKYGAGTGGQVVVTDETGRTLMAFFNDSFEEAILAAYFSGKAHGVREGEENARAQIRRAIGAVAEPAS